MAKINDNYLKLKAGYLFPEIGRRVKAFSAANPRGQDDPPGHRRRYPAACPRHLKAFHKAVDDMAQPETFCGYGPEQGYDFLLNAITTSPTSRCDVARRRDLHLRRLQVRQRQHPRHLRPWTTSSPSPTRSTPSTSTPTSWAATPARPTRTANTRASSTCRAPRRTTSSPAIPTQKVDIIYLCFPNNPTGAVATQGRPDSNGSITPAPTRPSSSSTPPTRRTSPTRRSRTRIYEIPGRARNAPSSSAASPRPPASPACAAARRSCPKTSRATPTTASEVELNKLWTRRHTTKFNGVSYIVQTRRRRGLHRPKAASRSTRSSPTT